MDGCCCFFFFFFVCVCVCVFVCVFGGTIFILTPGVIKKASRHYQSHIYHLTYLDHLSLSYPSMVVCCLRRWWIRFVCVCRAELPLLLTSRLGASAIITCAPPVCGYSQVADPAPHQTFTVHRCHLHSSLSCRWRNTSWSTRLTLPDSAFSTQLFSTKVEHFFYDLSATAV